MWTLRTLPPERRRNWLWANATTAPRGVPWEPRLFTYSWLITQGVVGLDTELRLSCQGITRATKQVIPEYASRCRPTKTMLDLADDDPAFATWHLAAGKRIVCCPDWNDELGNRTRPIVGAVDILSVAPRDRCRKKALVFEGETHRADGQYTTAYRALLDLVWRRADAVNPNDWPPSLLPWSYRSGTKPRALIPLRAALVARFGSLCVICQGAWATKIDHDHTTGLVRGYLCSRCNNVVDLCHHASSEDCAYAAYLNDPPAKPLGLVHPEEAILRRINLKYQQRVALYHAVVGRLDCACPG